MALLLCTLPALASVKSTPGRQVWDDDDGLNPTEVTGNLHCQVIRVETDRTLRVLSETGEHQVRINEKVPIRAQAKRQFEGRRKLDFADFSPGQWLKLTYLHEDGRIRRVRVMEKAPAGVDVAVWTEGAATATLVDEPGAGPEPR
jgi:hypothetical protein